MDVEGMMNQQLVLYPKTAYNDEGRETVGSGVTVKARVQITTKRRLLPNGNIVIVSAIAYVPAATVVATDDKAVYGTVNYKVFSRYDAIDGSGAINHIKLELIKWQTT